MQISSSINTHNTSAQIQNVSAYTRKSPSEGTRADATEDKLQQQRHIQNQNMQKTVAQKIGIGGSLDLRA